MSKNFDYFGTFLDTMNRPTPQQLAQRLRTAEDRNVQLAMEKGQLVSENRRLQAENSELARQNERLTNLLELALKEKGVGTKISTVA